jgi:hypothetical protein
MPNLNPLQTDRILKIWTRKSRQLLSLHAPTGIAYRLSRKYHQQWIWRSAGKNQSLQRFRVGLISVRPGTSSSVVFESLPCRQPRPSHLLINEKGAAVTATSWRILWRPARIHSARNPETKFMVSFGSPMIVRIKVYLWITGRVFSSCMKTWSGFSIARTKVPTSRQSCISANRSSNCSVVMTIC